MTDNQLTKQLVDAISRAREGTAGFIPIEYTFGSLTGQNQFLFFMKPELLENLAGLEGVISLIMDGIHEYDFSIERMMVLSGRYLAEYGIISEHYGIIDAVARNPRENLAQKAADAFLSEYQISFDEAPVIGSIDYLDEYPDMSADELSKAWLDGGYKRLGSGTYCQYIDDKNLYLINGFYPRLLQHFIDGQSCIASFVLRADLSWETARRDFVGVTEPEKAVAGSIRNELLKQKEQLGVGEVSPNLNGVHLSAGPVEGLVELKRFTTDHSTGKGTAALAEFTFGKTLQESFETGQIDSILANKTVTVDGRETTVFDLTEERNADESIDILLSVGDQLA